jgi:hypothetical protein
MKKSKLSTKSNQKHHKVIETKGSFSWMYSLVTFFVLVGVSIYLLVVRGTGPLTFFTAHTGINVIGAPVTSTSGNLTTTTTTTTQTDMTAARDGSGPAVVNSVVKTVVTDNNHNLVSTTNHITSTPVIVDKNSGKATYTPPSSSVDRTLTFAPNTAVPSTKDTSGNIDIASLVKDPLTSPVVSTTITATTRDSSGKIITQTQTFPSGVAPVLKSNTAASSVNCGRGTCSTLGSPVCAGSWVMTGATMKDNSGKAIENTRACVQCNPDSSGHQYDSNQANCGQLIATGNPVVMGADVNASLFGITDGTIILPCFQKSGSSFVQVPVGTDMGANASGVKTKCGFAGTPVSSDTFNSQLAGLCKKSGMQVDNGQCKTQDQISAQQVTQAAQKAAQDLSDAQQACSAGAGTLFGGVGGKCVQNSTVNACVNRGGKINPTSGQCSVASTISQTTIAIAYGCAVGRNSDISIETHSDGTSFTTTCGNLGCNGTTGKCNGAVDSPASIINPDGTKNGGDTNNASDCHYGVAGPGKTAKYECSTKPIKVGGDTNNAYECAYGVAGPGKTAKYECNLKQVNFGNTTGTLPRRVASSSECNSATETAISVGMGRSGGYIECQPKVSSPNTSNPATLEPRRVSSASDCNASTETAVSVSMGKAGGYIECRPNTPTTVINSSEASSSRQVLLASDCNASTETAVSVSMGKAGGYIECRPKTNTATAGTVCRVNFDGIINGNRCTQVCPLDSTGKAVFQYDSTQKMNVCGVAEVIVNNINTVGINIGGDTSNPNDCKYGIAGPGKTATYACNITPSSANTTAPIKNGYWCHSNSSSCESGYCAPADIGTLGIFSTCENKGNAQTGFPCRVNFDGILNGNRCTKICQPDSSGKPLFHYDSTLHTNVCGQ